MSTLVDLWDATERARPDHLALIHGDVRRTYRELGRQIRRLAATCVERWGLTTGDVVSLWMPNGPEFIASYFALVRVGAVVQPLDERLATDPLRAILADARPRALIGHRAFAARAAAVRADLPPPERCLTVGGVVAEGPAFEEWTDGPEPPEASPAPAPTATAELMYTSGTTGEPKGVMRSHANVRAAARNSIRGFGYRDDDVIAIVMPLSHSSALNSQMMPLVALGGTLVLLERFEVHGLLAAIRTHRVSCMRAVPTMLRMLLASPEFCRAELPSLRLIVNSSAPIDPETYRAVAARFPGIEIMNSYGLTEASTCTVLTDALARRHPDSIGQPIEGVEMRVVDEQDREVPDGTEGEILIRGEHVFQGYHGRAEETRAVLRGDWLYTGDLGIRDTQGLYFLHGRRSDAINCGGYKTMPAEVESCILQIPGVAEVAVVGAPHRVLGQVVQAFVVRRGPELDAKTVTRHCARLLPSHKIPFHVSFVDELPKNSTGKVQRHLLKEAADD